MVISAVACHFFCGIEETGNSYYFPKFTFIKLSNDIQLAMFSFKVARIQIFSWRTPAKVRSNLNIIVTLIICKSTVWVNFSKQKLNNSKNSGNCQLNILTFHLVIFVSLPSCADHSRFPIPDSPFPILPFRFPIPRFSNILTDRMKNFKLRLSLCYVIWFP